MIFSKRRGGFYVDLAHAILNADSLLRFLKAGEDHLITYEEPRQADIYAEMLDNLNQSKGSLRGMMDGLVPTSDLLLLAAIDRGRTDQEKHDGLIWLASTIETLNELKKLIIGSVAILGFIVPIVAVTLVIIATNFIPLFEKILTHEYWSGLGQSLYWVSYIATNWAFVLVPTLIILTYFIYKSFSNWVGNSRYLFEKKARVIRLPYLLYRDYMSANFLVGLSGLLTTKVSLKASLEALHEAASPFLRWHIETILDNLKNNPKSITEAFDTGLLAPDLHLRLANYSHAKGGFESGLIDLATNGLKHVKGEVEKSSKYLSILTIIFVVLSLGYLYFSNIEIAYSIKNHQEANIQSKS